jgi:hypothetical protein
VFGDYSDSDSGLGFTTGGKKFFTTSRNYGDYESIGSSAVNEEKSGHHVKFDGDTYGSLKKADTPSFWDIF